MVGRSHVGEESYIGQNVGDDCGKAMERQAREDGRTISRKTSWRWVWWRRMPKTVIWQQYIHTGDPA